MGSLIMHIAASNIIAKKYNLTDSFLAGAIMPDIYGKCGINRNTTHYINPLASNLPDYNKYIAEQGENIAGEISLGYLAHLVEDYVWFDKYINRYAKVVSENPYRIMFLNDGSIHPGEEFADNIYKDYTFIDYYICKKHDLDIEKIRNDIKKYFEIAGSKEKLDEYFYLHEYDPNRKSKFITYQDVDEFIETSSNKVDKILKEYIKNK